MVPELVIDAPDFLSLGHTVSLFVYCCTVAQCSDSARTKKPGRAPDIFDSHSPTENLSFQRSRISGRPSIEKLVSRDGTGEAHGLQNLIKSSSSSPATYELQ